MLEVHPAHHTPNTWRDFFIHIATIVVGLLIAVGLKQTVEYFHHRHQVTEIREALRGDMETSMKLLARDEIELRRQHSAILVLLNAVQANFNGQPRETQDIAA